MPEIKCPHCQKLFTIDESGYIQIAQQVRDKEFNRELESRRSEIEDRMDAEIKLAVADKDKEIEILKGSIDKLKNEIERNKIQGELEISNAVREKENEIVNLNAEKRSMKESYENQLRSKDEMIEQYRDFKARLSTKMVGESLEQHCSNEFNKIRMTAFPNANFYKDNDIKGGSKGDFIFREASEDGIEFISIMFEMKNEMDDTVSKHKNEDFFKKLDKDRRAKNCEYAVLVSMLEMDNELYNNGIVDVSYAYEKMFVIRPQFFIPIISLLRNASLKSLNYRRELEKVRSREADFSRFEENLMQFKESFGKNYRIASEHFQKAIDEIDKSIKHMQDVKEYLEKSVKQLGNANKKAEELSVKKLTKDSPVTRRLIEETQNRNYLFEAHENYYEGPEEDVWNASDASDQLYEEYMEENNRESDAEDLNEENTYRSPATESEINDQLWGDDE